MNVRFIVGTSHSNRLDFLTHAVACWPEAGGEIGTKNPRTKAGLHKTPTVSEVAAETLQQPQRLWEFCGTQL